MRKIVLIFCLLMLPLTLVSQTQHRFQVFVRVGGKDEQAINTIESHLKRELRLLGDVDIVGSDKDWKYIIEIYVVPLEWKDGTKTGTFVISTCAAVRLKRELYNVGDDYERYLSTYNGILGSAYHSENRLHEFCINYAASFDKKLETIRGTFKK